MMRAAGCPVAECGERLLSLADAAREAGLNVLDVRPMMEASGDPLGCYFKTDPHWNARGHAIAGRELFKAIQERAPK